MADALLIPGVGVVESGSDTLLLPGGVVVGASTPIVAAALYPAPGDVRYGVIYGPDGIYTGTLRNSGGVWLRRR